MTGIVPTDGPHSHGVDTQREADDEVGGQVLSELTLTSGVAQLRQLHPDRQPVLVLIAEGYQPTLVGREEDISGYDLQSHEEAKRETDPTYAAGLYVDPEDEPQAILISEEGQFGVSTDLVVPHEARWPMSTATFSIVAGADEEGKYDRSATDQHGTSRPDSPWKPARLLDEYANTSEGRAYLLLLARRLTPDEMQTARGWGASIN